MQNFVTITDNGIEYVEEGELKDKLGPNTFVDFQEFYAGNPVTVIDGKPYYKKTYVDTYVATVNFQVKDQHNKAEGGETVAPSRT